MFPVFSGYYLHFNWHSVNAFTGLVNNSALSERRADVFLLSPLIPHKLCIHRKIISQWSPSCSSAVLISILMPQSWSPPPPGVSRRQGISRSQLLSSWSRVWIYMLAVRAPHKSKLVVWALSGPGWDNRREVQSWDIPALEASRANLCRALPLCVSFTVASIVIRTSIEVISISWGSAQWLQPVTSYQWHPDLHSPHVSQRGDGDITRWDHDHDNLAGAGKQRLNIVVGFGYHSLFSLQYNNVFLLSTAECN